jgi:hypothetical protein
MSIQDRVDLVDRAAVSLGNSVDAGYPGAPSPKKVCARKFNPEGVGPITASRSCSRLRSDLIDPTIALHHRRFTDVSVVLHHSVWMDSESGLPDLDSTVVARIFPRRRHSVGVIDLCAAKTRPKWELSLKPQEKAMSVTVR